MKKLAKVIQDDLNKKAYRNLPEPNLEPPDYGENPFDDVWFDDEDLKESVEWFNENERYDRRMSFEEFINNWFDGPRKYSEVGVDDSVPNVYAYVYFGIDGDANKILTAYKDGESSATIGMTISLKYSEDGYDEYDETHNLENHIKVTWEVSEDKYDVKVEYIG